MSEKAKMGSGMHEPGPSAADDLGSCHKHSNFMGDWINQYRMVGHSCLNLQLRVDQTHTINTIFV